MSPRTHKQFEEIRESKKELIRSKALKLFARDGYYTTSISKIATDAKISKGLIYNYYESKEQLLKDIIFSGMKKITELADPDHDGIMTDEELLNMLNIIKEMLQKDRRFWTLYFSILPQPSVMKIVKHEIDEMYKNMVGIFADYFKREGYEEPEAEALILGSLLDGVSFNYLYNPHNYPIDKVINRIIQLYSKK